MEIGDSSDQPIATPDADNPTPASSGSDINIYQERIVRKEKGIYSGSRRVRRSEQGEEKVDTDLPDVDI